MQEAAQKHHPDLYHAGPDGWPTLRIQGGCIDATSINAAPFGVGFALDLSELTPASEWQPPIHP